MATYKFGKYEQWDGVLYFAIFKRGFFGNWIEQKYWVITSYGSDRLEKEERQRLLMMESVDRLVKAGHTVI